jgi:hypothetical protein
MECVTKENIEAYKIQKITVAPQQMWCTGNSNDLEMLKA